MKTKRVKNDQGKTVTLYYPENDADVDRLNAMLEAGKLAPPEGSPAPVVD